MARRLVINRLDKDELTYELAYRGVATGTCEEMRHRLVQVMQMERYGESLRYPSYPFTFEEDEAAIRGKLDDIRRLIDDITDSGTSSGAMKLQTKLAHVLNRIDNMDPDKDKDKETRKSELLGLALSLMDEFSHKVDSSKRSDTKRVPVALNQLESRLGAQSFHANLGAVARSSLTEDPVFDPCSTSKMIPPYKWNLKKFSGDGKGMSVTAFFEGIEELRLARHVPNAVLLDSGVDLFADKAYQFYKDCRNRVSTWEELVEEFREEYLSANHSDALFEELQKRTQHHSETIGVYLAVMSSYFSRLGCPMTEEAKLNIVMKNLHPFYQDRLREPLPTTISELRSVCRRMEARRDIINSYVEPSARRGNVIEKDLAFVEVTKELNALEIATARIPSNNQSKEIVCFRCDQPGHRAIGCALPKQLECYRCKRKGYTVRNCPNCSVSGNDKRRL
ncbi:uncharacterized protein [Leptinotarsa decemlineata]|uniref:uncharacterized protein n=1 Tax=Leptinotarsa decemlineata TaxID=7539 RepID=UPI003D30CCE7